MYYVINLLEKHKENIILNLKQGKADNVNKIKEIDNVLKWLYIIKKFSLENPEKYNILELPQPQNGRFSEYSIVDDAEGSEKEFWNKLEINGKAVTAILGDIVITRK